MGFIFYCLSSSIVKEIKPALNNLFISILMTFTDFGICREHESLQMPTLW